MARPFDSNTLALLASASLVERSLFIVRLPEGTWGFWDDVFDTTFPDFPGVTFTGSGSLLSFTDVQQTAKATIQSLSVILSGLETGVLATVGQYNLHAGTVEVAKALYHPDTRALVATVTVFRGFIDRDTLSERSEGGAIVSTLSLTCESRALELDRATHRTRSHTDQRRLSSGDRGMEWTSRTGTRPIPWGQEAAKGQKGFGGGNGGRRRRRNQRG